MKVSYKDAFVVGPLAEKIGKVIDKVVDKLDDADYQPTALETLVITTAIEAVAEGSK